MPSRRPEKAPHCNVPFRRSLIGSAAFSSADAVAEVAEAQTGHP